VLGSEQALLRDRVDRIVEDHLLEIVVDFEDHRDQETRIAVEVGRQQDIFFAQIAQHRGDLDLRIDGESLQLGRLGLGKRRRLPIFFPSIRWWPGRGTALQPINPRQHFGHCDVKRRRDVLVEVDLREQSGQFTRYVDRHAGRARPLDDFFGNQPCPLATMRAPCARRTSSPS